MKKYLILAAAFSALFLSAGDKLFEMDRKGNLLFKKATLFNFSPAGYERFTGYVFNGKSILEIELDGGAYKNNSLSVSVTACATELPGHRGGTLFLRPGFHNALSIDRQGRVVFSIWCKSNASSKYDKNIKLFSKRKIRLGKGRFFRAAYTLAPLPGGKTAVKLYLDGAKEAETVINEQIYSYKRVCYIGGASFLKDACFKGIIRSAAIFNKPLSDAEIAALQ